MRHQDVPHRQSLSYKKQIGNPLVLCSSRGGALHSFGFGYKIVVPGYGVTNNEEGPEVVYIIYYLRPLASCLPQSPWGNPGWHISKHAVSSPLYASDESTRSQGRENVRGC